MAKKPIQKWGKVFVRAAAVEEFLDNWTFSSSNENDLKASIKNVLGELIAQIGKYQEIEKKVYTLFEISNLGELQERIDFINKNSELKQLSSSLISKSALGKKLKNSEETYSDLATTFHDYIVNASNENGKLYKTIDGAEYQIISQSFLDNWYQIFNEKRQNSGGKFIQKKIFKDNFKKFLKKKDLKALSSYKDEIKVILESRGKKDSHQTKELEIGVSGTFEEKNNKTSNGLVSYPYFRLADEEKNEARKDKEGWNIFKENILSLIPNFTESGKLAFDLIPIDNFFVDDLSGVKGVLGEYATLVEILYLVKNNISKVNYVGNIRDETKGKNNKLSIDILLDGQYGIQVKNYTPYRNENQAGYSLKEKLTFKELKNRVKNDENLSLVEQFLAARAYNTPVSKIVHVSGQTPFEEIRRRLISNTSEQANATKSILSTYVKDIFHFEQTLINKELGFFEKTSVKNAFYMIEGKVVVPTSRILKLLYDRIKEFYKALEKIYRINNFSFSISYSGDRTFPKDYGANFKKKRFRSIENGKDKLDWAEVPNYVDISNNIALRMNINLNLNDLDFSNNFYKTEDLLKEIGGN